MRGDSNSKNGSTKCPMTMAMRSPPHTPREWSRYHGTSIDEVRLPNDQKLHEIEVDPQDHQREQQLAEISSLVRRRRPAVSNTAIDSASSAMPAAAIMP